MRLVELKQPLNESRYLEVNYPEHTSKEVVAKLDKLFAKLAKDNAKHVVGADSVPAAPNTGSFRAHRGGMIDHEHNVTCHGAYNSSTTYASFLKIGSRVDTKVHADIRAKIKQEVTKLVGKAGDTTTSIFCDDAIVMVIEEEGGSNWGGFGVKLSKLSSYRPKD